MLAESQAAKASHPSKGRSMAAPLGSSLPAFAVNAAWISAMAAAAQALVFKRLAPKNSADQPPIIVLFVTQRAIAAARLGLWGWRNSR